MSISGYARSVDVDSSQSIIGALGTRTVYSLLARGRVLVPDGEWSQDVACVVVFVFWEDRLEPVTPVPGIRGGIRIA